VSMREQASGRRRMLLIWCVSLKKSVKKIIEKQEKVDKHWKGKNHRLCNNAQVVIDGVRKEHEQLKFPLPCSGLCKLLDRISHGRIIYLK